MSREDAQMKIRLTPDLRDRIIESAKTNNRTLNAEITARIEMAYEFEERGPKIQQALTMAIKNAEAMESMMDTMNTMRQIIEEWKRSKELPSAIDGK